MASNNFDDAKKKIDDSASFYDKFLNIDYKLADYCFQTIKPFFRGNFCLEIGPANGLMTKHLVNAFKYVDVVEPSARLLAKIPEYNNLRKFNTVIEDFKSTQKYDTIIMSHVLEHIKEPLVALSNIKSLLVSNGLFIVSVPNAKSIHRLVAVEMGLLKSEYELNSRDHELGHYRVYDQTLLRDHLVCAGFNVLHEGGTL